MEHPGEDNQPLSWLSDASSKQPQHELHWGYCLHQRERKSKEKTKSNTLYLMQNITTVQHHSTTLDIEQKMVFYYGYHVEYKEMKKCLSASK